MFSENLREAMFYARINQAKLSELSGISKSAISQYLSGKSVPTKHKQTEIAVAMGLAKNYFTDKDNKEDEASGVLEQISVSEVAKIMGKSLQFVYLGLQQGIFPWGYGVEMPGGRWSYFVNAERFRKIECMEEKNDT